MQLPATRDAAIKKMWRTPNQVNKFEVNRIIGLRALQITSMHSRHVLDGDSVVEAAVELMSGNLPFSIRRPLPDGTFEDRDWTSLTLPREHIQDTYLHRIRGREDVMISTPKKIII